MKNNFEYDSAKDEEVYLDRKEIVVGNRIIHIEAGTTAGNPGQANEDSFAAALRDNTFVAGVFDGASSLKPIETLKDQTGARFAAQYLKEQLPLTSSEETLKDAVIQLNDGLREAYTPLGVTVNDTDKLPSAVGTIIRINENEISFVHVGDSFGIVYDKHGNSSVFAQYRGTEFGKSIFVITNIALEQGITHREARQDERVKQAIIDERNGTHNNPDGSGVGVINGNPNIANYIDTGTININDVSAILIGSDGLLPPGWSLDKEEDRQRMLAEVKAGGFRQMFEVKRQVEDEDPDWNNVRYKHSDDATGFLVELN